MEAAKRFEAVASKFKTLETQPAAKVKRKKKRNGQLEEATPSEEAEAQDPVGGA